MPTFKYRVRTSTGQLQAGAVDAPTMEDANEALAERGFEIVLLEPAGAGGVGTAALSFLNRISTKDIVIVARTLSVMVSAAVPLVDALKNIARQTENPNLKIVMNDVSTEVEGGARLSDAFERHPKVFSGFFINMIRSGETSGQLEQVLEYLADQQEKDYDLTSKIRGALIYPAFILTALGVVGFIMMSFVVPKLTQILQEANVPLPISTRILIVVSGFFANFWWLIIILVIILIVVLRIVVQTPGGRMALDKLMLNVPVFGTLFERIYVVRFCRSLGTLLHGGVDQVGALEIVAGVVGNQVWKKMVFETIKEVNEGNSITTAFLRSKHVPTMMNQMLSVGEETGKLQEVLQRVASFFNREVDNLVANLVTLIEPIVMVILGIGVGVMVSAILLPLYQLSSAV
ncbi:MAG TPA: type II secretion system F family protein [Candidatus Methylomirabilis sp.]|nr:type II secretion system F family protein [Candidatus Methylomirabilis sp.]